MMQAPGFVPVAGWESDRETPLQLTVHVPVPADPGVQLRVRVWVKESPLQKVLAKGDQALHPEMTRSVHGVPQALALVPVAGRVSVESVLQVCVNESPSHTVDGAGLHVPLQVGGGGGHPVDVPVAGRVSAASVLQVCVNGFPSQTVEGAGSHVPGQWFGSQVPVVEVPRAVRVTELSALQVWVKVTPWHSVAGSGPHVPPQSGGGVVEQVALRSVPVAGRVELSQRFVCVNAVASQTVDTSGPQCEARVEKQLGVPHSRPSIVSPATSGGAMSGVHSQPSPAAGQPPGGVSSIQTSPRRFVCSPVGDPDT